MAKKLCKRGYRKVGNTCRKIKKFSRAISKNNIDDFIAILFGFITYSFIGRPITKWIDNFAISTGIRIFLGLIALGLFYYFFKND